MENSRASFNNRKRLLILCFSRGKTKINGDSYRESNFG